MARKAANRTLSLSIHRPGGGGWFAENDMYHRMTVPSARGWKESHPTVPGIFRSVRLASIGSMNVSASARLDQAGLPLQVCVAGVPIAL